MNKAVAILSLLGLCLVARPSSSQEDDLEMELYFAPAETVSSATRHVQPLDESPSAVTVITREDIEASGARSLPEVLRLVPNMDVSVIKPMWYEVGVRGGTTDSADTLLLLVDGRDATLELFGFPIWGVYPVSMDEVERIEVIRGPGSALYGANAYAGVVHVITRPPGEGPSASVSVRGGEIGSNELSGSLTGKIGPLALSAAGGLARENLWTARETGKRVTRGQLKGKLDLGSNTSLLLDVGTYLAEGPVHTGLGDVDLREAMDTYVVARFNFHDLEVLINYSRLDFDVDFGMELFEKGLGVVLARVPSSLGGNNKLGIQARHAWELVHNRISYGADFVYNHAFAEVLDPSDHYEKRYAFYLQDEIDLKAILNDLFEVDTPTLILTAGLRFDGNTRTKWEISPRASLVCMPGENHSLRLGYAHAFLKPTLFESSVVLRLEDPFDPSLDRLSMANPDIENQTIDSLELGYAVDLLDKRLTVRLDLAYNWYANQIWFNIDPSRMDYIQIGTFRIPDISGPGIDFQNMPGVYQGHNLELQVIARPTERSRIFVHTGYRQLFESDPRLFSRAEPVWRLGLGVDWMSENGFSTSIRAYYKSAHSKGFPDRESMFEPSVELRLPAQLLLNARVAWKISSGPFDLSAGIEAFNLLDQRVRQFAGESVHNHPDHSGERIDRRILFFLQGQLW